MLQRSAGLALFLRSFSSLWSRWFMLRVRLCRGVRVPLEASWGIPRCLLG